MPCWQMPCSAEGPQSLRMKLRTQQPGWRGSGDSLCCAGPHRSCASLQGSCMHAPGGVLVVWTSRCAMAVTAGGRMHVHSHLRWHRGPSASATWQRAIDAQNNNGMADSVRSSLGAKFRCYASATGKRFYLARCSGRLSDALALECRPNGGLVYQCWVKTDACRQRPLRGFGASLVEIWFCCP